MEKENIKFGWIKDKKDKRDFKWKARPYQVEVLPPSADLRYSATPIHNQGSLGSCTAHAGTGLFEWLENDRTGHFIERSRSFLYKEAQDLSNITDDSGAYLRDTAKVMADEGLPPENAWPYSKYPEEPSDEIRALAIKCHVDSYWRLDGSTYTETLQNIKAVTALKKLPVMLGFLCYDSVFDVDRGGVIPIPDSSESEAGGHAVSCLGYDDSINALLIKNSWGVDWGNGGYGWLPYWYTQTGKVEDCWVIAEASHISDPEDPIEPPKKSLCQRIMSWFGV